MSSSAALTRIARAAETHGWGLSALERPPAIMATRDSGHVGAPWVVLATVSGDRLQVSFFNPGDSLDAPGEELDEFSGNPRELGRLLRGLLEELATGRAA
jgi:hypothetical protein